MQITWRWTAWAGLLACLFLVVEWIYSLWRVKDMGAVEHKAESYIVMTLIFSVPLSGAIWLTWHAFRASIVNWQFWVVIGVCSLAAILFFIMFVEVIKDPSEVLVHVGLLIPIIVALLVTTATGIHNGLVSLASQQSTQVAAWANNLVACPS
jgi:magnesium-transporting ATPase (P-type)